MEQKRAVRKGNKSKIIAAIIVMLLLVCLCLFFLITQSRDPGKNISIENAVGSSEEAIKNAVPHETLVFASDYQYQGGWDEPSATLTALLEQVKSAGAVPTNIIYCGDYTNDEVLQNYQLSPDDSIQEIRDIAAEECSTVSQDNMIFVQGNHDKLTEAVSDTGLHEYDNYLVYVLNTQYSFPWKQGKDPAAKERVISASEEMKACFDDLIARGETRPVIIAGHVPLHFTARTSSKHSTGDNMYASYIFDAVNEAGESLDILYLFGHNHSKGWDCYLGGSSVFRQAGEEILVPSAGNNTSSTDDFTVNKLNFTYMNAGYTGYYMNCGPAELNKGRRGDYTAADETLTVTTCEIRPDELVITRFSAEGQHPLSWDGEGDPYKGGIDAGLIGSEFYSTRKDSPAHIQRMHKKGGNI